MIDLKPYTPSLDRVESPVSPDWSAHWPRSVETSGAFDGAAEFRFQPCARYSPASPCPAV